MRKWHFLMKKNANAFSMRSGSLVRFSFILIFHFSLWMFIIIIIIINIKKISLRKEERKNEEKKTLQTRNVESRWHDDGNGKNVHTINLNLIQIAFCHHYKAKASLLLSPHTFIMKKGKIPGAKNTYIFTSNPPIKISSFYTRINDVDYENEWHKHREYSYSCKDDRAECVYVFLN